MSLRTSRRNVTFRRAFALRGLDGMQPAGTYEVETDEELLEHLSFPAWHRIATTIRLPLPGSAASYQKASIDPAELQAAQTRDAEDVQRT